ncbi:Uncharacterised protein [Mycobacterium tuberculosis]|nr:Uncharacterised protein [Mycobacterium tuberculosis]
MVGARRFEQRDGFGDGTPLRHAIGFSDGAFERLCRIHQHTASDATRQR